MGSFRIEFADKFIEPGLLLEGVSLWRPGGFFLEGQMHALMTAVLLGVAGFDTLNVNAEPEPPDRQRRKIVKPVGTGEGQTIIRTDRIGQPTLFKQSLEGREGGDLLRRFKGFA